jgi:hypothetical protein
MHSLSRTQTYTYSRSHAYTYTSTCALTLTHSDTHSHILTHSPFAFQPHDELVLAREDEKRDTGADEASRRNMASEWDAVICVHYSITLSRREERD